MYIKLILSFLPDAFKSQNVSLTDIGENHTWIWDFDNIKEYLIKYDFNCIEKKEFNTTQVDFFSPYELDVFNQDIPRKGLQSMFIEAKKIILRFYYPFIQVNDFIGCFILIKRFNF